MDIASTILYWILMVFLQYSPYSQIQQGDSYVFMAEDCPGVGPLVIRAECLGDPSKPDQYYWKMYFTAEKPGENEPIASYTAYVYQDAGAYKLKLLRDKDNNVIFPRNDEQPPLFLTFGTTPRKNLMIHADEHYKLPVSVDKEDGGMQNLTYKQDGMTVSVIRSNDKGSSPARITIKIKDILFLFNAQSLD